jgi:hypothetical protein
MNQGHGVPNELALSIANPKIHSEITLIKLVVRSPDVFWLFPSIPARKLTYVFDEQASVCNNESFYHLYWL